MTRLPSPNPYPDQHSQACFGMHSGGCVCPLGSREARIKQEATAMEALLRTVLAEINDPDGRLGLLKMRMEQDGLREILARIDAPPAGT